MKTLQQFLEATEKDLKDMGASQQQVDALKKRQQKRGKGFSTGDDRVEKSKPASTQKALPPGKPGGQITKSSSGKPSPADKGSSLVKQKQSSITKPGVEKVNVKDVTPKKPTMSVDSSKPAADAGPDQPQATSQRKKGKSNIGKYLSKGARKLGSFAKKKLGQSSEYDPNIRDAELETAARGNTGLR